MNDLVSVEFYGDQLEATQTPDGRVWVSLRRCCENLGVSIEGQLAKLRNKHWATMKEIFMVAEDGKQRAVTAVELDCLPLWLATIEPRKVHPRSKGTL